MVDFYWKSYRVSFDVAFITHDGATWCLRDQDEYKGTLKNSEEFELGNNCLLVPAILILPGVTIGDNSIVAVGAVVNKSIPSGGGVWGVPAPLHHENKTMQTSAKKKILLSMI